MYAERHVITITTDGSGNGTGYTPNVTGKVLTIRYVKTDFADGIDFVATLEATGEAILTATDCNASASFYPRVPVDDEAGADALFASGGTKLRDAVVAANDRVKIVVAQGGASKSGTFHVVVGE
jgi:hypothetical protein